MDAWMTSATSDWPVNSFRISPPPELRWPVDVPEWWPQDAAMCGIMQHGGWLWTDADTFTIQQGDVPNIEPGYSVKTMRCGWPCASLGWHEIREHHWNGPGPADIVRGRWDVDPIRIGWRSLELPLNPLWLGTIANTIVYAAAAWGIGTLVCTAHRRWRRKRGLCVGCGYDLRGLASGAVCPECGGGRQMTKLPNSQMAK